MGNYNRYLSVLFSVFILGLLLFTGTASALIFSIGSFSKSSFTQGEMAYIDASVQLVAQRINNATVMIDDIEVCTFDVDTAASLTSCPGISVAILSKNSTYGYGYGYGYGFGSGTNMYNISIDTSFITAGKHSFALKANEVVSSSSGFSVEVPITLPEEESIDDVSSISVYSQWNISLPQDGGVSEVSIPADTVITTQNGSNMDFSQFTFEDLDLSAIDNIDDVTGGLHFGISYLGLQFSSPVSLRIFVGSSHNGENMKLYRSVDGSSWTQDGLDPKQCTVVDGYCSFTTTKASFFTTTKNPVKKGGNGGTSYLKTDPQPQKGNDIRKDETKLPPRKNLVQQFVDMKPLAPLGDATSDDKKDADTPLVLAEENVDEAVSPITGAAVGSGILTLTKAIWITIIMFLLIAIISVYLFVEKRKKNQF